jgi:hypothetical protein
MKRRDFLKNAAIGAGALAVIPGFANAGRIEPARGEKAPEGPTTLYFECRLMGQHKDNFLDEMDELAKMIKEKRGFLSMSLKNMVGDSTMVKNYPSNLKGILRTAYLDAAKQNTMPLFYSLFLRFENYRDLKQSKASEFFAKVMKQYGPISKNYHEGVYVTVAAGDRKRIYTSYREIAAFLKSQKDAPREDLLTVNNHVGIFTKDKDTFNKESTALLKIAQDTFRPAKGDYDYTPRFPDGMPGSYQNHHYRKAVTTEILQSAFSEGDKTHYLFHGTWQTVWDHENSHLDIRFREAVMRLFPYIVEGPVEPFYKTIILENA